MNCWSSACFAPNAFSCYFDEEDDEFCDEEEVLLVDVDVRCADWRAWSTSAKLGKKVGGTWTTAPPRERSSQHFKAASDANVGTWLSSMKEVQRDAVPVRPGC